jgi:hypothetical protein
MASRTFVSFSSTDIKFFHLMLAWKEHEHIDFDFINCQLAQEVNSEDEDYIKKKCRERIDMAGTFVVLIGADTKSKHKYVRWEIETALEKKCRIICVNLDGSKKINDEICPNVLKNIGAIFVPFSAKVVGYALKNYKMMPDKNYQYNESVYKELDFK